MKMTLLKSQYLENLWTEPFLLAQQKSGNSIDQLWLSLKPFSACSVSSSVVHLRVPSWGSTLISLLASYR